MINAHYYDRVNRVPSDRELASVKLVLLSLHQDLILKSRIMGLVYFLETGKPDIPRFGNRSTRKPSSRRASRRRAGDGYFRMLARLVTTTIAFVLLRPTSGRLYEVD